MIANVFFIFIVTDVSSPLFCPNNCGRCYKGHRRKESLRRHLKDECGVPKRFQCAHCGKRFARKEYLNSHRLFVHKLT